MSGIDVHPDEFPDGTFATDPAGPRWQVKPVTVWALIDRDSEYATAAFGRPDDATTAAALLNTQAAGP